MRRRRRCAERTSTPTLPARIISTDKLAVCVPVALLLPLGYLAAAAALGEWVLSRRRSGAQPGARDRILMLIGVLLVLFVPTRIPVAGAALRFLLIIAGVGSLVMASALRHRGETATATTT